MPWSRDDIAARAAREIAPGSLVNLGIGLPTLVADHLPPDEEIWLQSENGILGMGPFPYEGDEDPQLVNAGKQTVSLLPGASIFDSAVSFAMIRGGHVDLAILGAMQVSQDGDLANWSIPGGKTLGVGGAMDLAVGARRIVVLTEHRTKRGESKLVDRCTYPLTAKAVVARVITDLAVLDIRDGAFHLIECAAGVTPDEVAAATGATVLW